MCPVWSADINVPCMECGYKGLMGVKDPGQRPFASAGWAIVIAALAAAMGFFGIFKTSVLLGAAWALFMNRTARPILSCPNCNADLNG